MRALQREEGINAFYSRHCELHIFVVYTRDALLLIGRIDTGVFRCNFEINQTFMRKAA